MAPCKYLIKCIWPCSSIFKTNWRLTNLKGFRDKTLCNFKDIDWNFNYNEKIRKKCHLEFRKSSQYCQSMSWRKWFVSITSRSKLKMLSQNIHGKYLLSKFDSQYVSKKSLVFKSIFIVLLNNLFKKSLCN